MFARLREALHSASALVGVAVANRLPSLTARGGSPSYFFSQSFARRNGFWSIAAAVTRPVFDGGTLQHRASDALAALEPVQAQYGRPR